MAKVKLVDNFHHGRVEVTVNEDIDRTLGYGDRTRYLSVTPSPSGNDVISVTWRKYPTCGIGDASQYFKAGHRYRLVVSVNDYGGRCGADGANNAKSPGFRVVKVD